MSTVCGIAGLVAPGPQDEAEAALHRMLAALRHRGPDDSGCEAFAADDGLTVALGAARLAILDPSLAGHQPMRDPETGNWIVFNGEIYNHPEVRRALGARTWRSGADTETVLRAYAEWGPECVARLKGMFAFVLWDQADRSLWCVRDRLGIKPFYYSASAGRFLFASEVRALLASGMVARRVDRAGLSGYIRFGSVPDPHTLIDGVESLRPGAWMRVQRGRVTEDRTYWRAGAAGPADRPLGAPATDVTEEVRERLVTSVREHLLSDVPVAAFLSGGLDSSIVTALSARASARPLRTFTIGFAERELDESRGARSVAERYGTEHRAVRLSDEEAASLVPAAVAALDQPSADGVNTFVVSRAVAQDGIKVVLSGLGGDEVFGGYPGFRLLPLVHRWAPLFGLVPAPLRRTAARDGSGERVAEVTARGVPLADRYQTARSFWSTREMKEMGVDPAIGYGAEDPGPGAPPATRLSVLEMTGYMRSTLLRDADAMSMAHSLELRVPFLDHELVECSLRRHAPDERGRKAVLRPIAASLLPPSVARGPKKGFVMPMDRWMRGPLRGLVSDGLAALRESRALPALDTGPVAARFESRRLRWSRLWELAVLGHWLDRNGVRA
jgi:asparagine synthase (glutamine-hydrolysing)